MTAKLLLALAILSPVIFPIGAAEPPSRLQRFGEPGSNSVAAGEFLVEPPTLINLQAPILVDLAKRGMERYGFNLNPTFSSSVPGDLGGYAPIGVARVQAIHSGPMYHTSGDVLETISVPGLERAARFYAFFVREAAQTPRKALNP